jgi:tetratricopeptide (TPR) repeat protein
MTNELDCLAQELEVAGSAHPRDAARYAAVLERAVRTCTINPAASEVFDLGELYLDLTTEYQQLGRVDDALAAADAVVASGLQMHPDARCLRAEILMRAGRGAEAEPIWAAVRAATPEDVWLYNNAGLGYADVGEHDTALHWLTDGLQLALRTGDPERLIDQLADLRQTSLDTLGLRADRLQDEAAAFLHKLEQTEPVHTRTIGPMSVAWLPAGDYEQALKRWPNFAESDLIATPDGPLSHALYCRAMQQKLVAYSEAGAPRFAVVPIRIAQFTAWCTERNHQPDSADVRAEYVSHLTAAGGPDLTAWPPGRNQPCWCGSGFKYKKCCASVSFVDRSQT